MNTGNIHSIVTKSLWTNTASITKQIDNSLGMLHGIGLTEFMVLSQLMDSPKKHMRRIDVAEAVGHMIPMEKIGLIEKEVNPRDARVSLDKISAVGETKLPVATTTLNERSEQIFDRLDKKQLEEFLKLLNLINSS